MIREIEFEFYCLHSFECHISEEWTENLKEGKYINIFEHINDKNRTILINYDDVEHIDRINLSIIGDKFYINIYVGLFSYFQYILKNLDHDYYQYRILYNNYEKEEELRSTTFKFISK